MSPGHVVKPKYIPPHARERRVYFEEQHEAIRKITNKHQQLDACKEGKKYVPPHARKKEMEDKTPICENPLKRRRDARGQQCQVVAGCPRAQIGTCDDCARQGCPQHIFVFHWRQCVECNERSWQVQPPQQATVSSQPSVGATALTVHGAPSAKWIPVFIPADTVKSTLGRMWAFQSGETSLGMSDMRHEEEQEAPGAAMQNTRRSEDMNLSECELVGESLHEAIMQ